MSGSVRVIEVQVPAGISRDSLLAALVERVPGGARLTETITYQDDVQDHVLTFEEDLPGPADSQE